MEAVFRMEAGYSTARVAQMTGLSPHQLDYLDRVGALHPARPAHGSGTKRCWSESDLDRVRLAACLRELCASMKIVGRVLGQLPAHPSSWPSYLWIEHDGAVKEMAPVGPGWWGVNVGRLLAERPATEHELMDAHALAV